MNLHSFAENLHHQCSTLTHIALIAHKSPDGDAYGSLEGMRHLLSANYPHLTISVVVPSEPHIDTHVSWVLANSVPVIPAGVQLVLLLDTSIITRTALKESEYPGQPIITIDHHEPRPESIGGYCDPDAASTTVILTDIARELHWTVTPAAATALLLGVYTDTGAFIHRNSNVHAFETAAYLLSSGADQNRITAEAFGNYTLDYLHSLGQGLLSIVQAGAIACLFFQENENNGHLKSHIIGYLSGLANVDIACVLIQKGTEVKGSLRTRKDTIDVDSLAKKLGGGGHKKASGFEIQATLTGETLLWNEKKYTPKDFINYLSTLL